MIHSRVLLPHDYTGIEYCFVYMHACLYKCIWFKVRNFTALGILQILLIYTSIEYRQIRVNVKAHEKGSLVLGLLGTVLWHRINIVAISWKTYLIYLCSVLLLLKAAVLQLIHHLQDSKHSSKIDKEEVLWHKLFDHFLNFFVRQIGSSLKL